MRPPRLPRLLVLTDRTQADEPLEDTLVRLADHGVGAMVLREKDLPHDERSRLVDRVTRRLAAHDVVLLVALARDARAAGARVHLAADADLPTPRPEIVGRSCHDAEELARAAAEGCDYVTVSPVFPSDSKPGHGPCLGPEGLGRLLGGAPPAYALGGVLPEHVEACLSAGAAGVAVMGPLMRDPARAVDYLAALAQEIR